MLLCNQNIIELLINHFSPRRNTVKRINMKLDNEVMWNTAENFAKIVNDAYQKRLEQDNMLTNKDTFIKVVGWIEDSETKKGFVGNCTTLIKNAPSISNELSKIVEMVVGLPMASGADNQDITFEMFIALVKFHVECVKPKWK